MPRLCQLPVQGNSKSVRITYSDSIIEQNTNIISNSWCSCKQLVGSKWIAADFRTFLSILKYENERNPISSPPADFLFNFILQQPHEIELRQSGHFWPLRIFQGFEVETDVSSYCLSHTDVFSLIVMVPCLIDLEPTGPSWNNQFCFNYWWMNLVSFFQF